jgi:UDPglucose--hexose-1-phosphate uridylyltransferase
MPSSLPRRPACSPEAAAVSDDSDFLVRDDLLHPDGRAFHIYGRRGDWDLRSADTPSGYDAAHLHRRFDRLTGSWVLVSPARNVRPSATTGGDDRPVCPLCPGGAELPGGFRLAVFDNRFPALSEDAPAIVGDELVASSRGRCEVIVHTDEHVERTSELSCRQLAAVMAVLRERTTELWAAGFAYVMAFENHGTAVGATLPHQHGQIYAVDHLPTFTAAKCAQARRHRAEHGHCLGCMIVDEDVAGGRVVEPGEHFVAAVPFAPQWPYEVHVRARRHGVGRLGDLDDDAALELARILATMIDRYDAMWGFDLPYMLAVQEAPAGEDGQPLADWHLHLELLPPHRNPSRLKVRASSETVLGLFINDTLPEDTAAALRDAHPRRRDWQGVRLPRIEYSA